MLNIASGANIMDNTVVYQLDNSLTLPKSNQPGVEARLARRGLMVGLAMYGDSVQLTLVGNLNQKSSALFKEFMQEVLLQGYTGLIFDLTNLQIVDGNGLASLIWVRNQLVENGGHLTIRNLSSKVRNTLLAVNFQYLVNIADYDYR